VLIDVEVPLTAGRINYICEFGAKITYVWGLAKGIRQLEYQATGITPQTFTERVIELKLEKMFHKHLFQY
jgi:hypothetical protein